jgi:CheY-like chemotaxis protein
MRGQPEVAPVLGFALKILLVDDDPLQASVRKSILERQFSDVLRVTDAAEALCLVEEPQFALNLGLVISGHHLAGIGGPAFVAELHTRIPLLPVLVLGESSLDRTKYSGENVTVLTQPIFAKEMLATVGRMMSQSAHKTA